MLGGKYVCVRTPEREEKKDGDGAPHPLSRFKLERLQALRRL